MATSPNYAWAEPDNSSLVKNGAADIRTLGDAIDTSLWNVGFGQAGKNKIINGNFGVWQRGTSFSVTSAVYTADRFKCSADTTTTFSQQTFTAGTAPVSGYEGTFFLRAATGAGTSYVDVSQPIEDVRTFAGQTVTFSFWAKANSATTVTSFFRQSFGSGGSANVDTTGASASLTTSWQRFTVTVAIPSISGKTIGTGSALIPVLYCNSGAASKSIDIWGVQLEYGSKATPFQTATGTIQGELAACQRYYYQNALGNNFFTTGAVYSGTSARFTLVDPVQMRTTPTGLVTQNLTVSIPRTGSTVNTGTWAITYATPTTTTVTYTHGSSVLTAGDVAEAYGNNANSYIGWSAEL